MYLRPIEVCVKKGGKEISLGYIEPWRKPRPHRQWLKGNTPVKDAAEQGVDAIAPPKMACAVQDPMKRQRLRRDDRCAFEKDISWKRQTRADAQFLRHKRIRHH